MGHSEAVHASRYLVEEQAEHKLAHLSQRRALDEGRPASRFEVVPVIREVTRLPEGVTPELIELARKLRVAGLG
jgi:hypothetical protein